MARKVPPLTDAAIRNVKSLDKSFTLFDGDGLYLAILPSDGKSWRFKYRFDGQEKRLVFGAWPGMGAKLARKKRDDARELLAKGIDPGQKRKADDAAKKARKRMEADTFEVVARDWHAKQVQTWSVTHGVKVLACMEQYLFPAFGAAPIATLRAPGILPALCAVEAKGINYTAKKLRQFCESIFAFAVATGRAERNVGADLRGALAPCRVKNRPAITDPKKVAALLRAIDGYEGSPVTLAALRLAPLLFVRPGELRQAEWNEIDLDNEDGPWWLIPGEKMKMRVPHIVPLSRQAVEVITGLHPLTGAGRYLFPCNRLAGRCMSNMTINAALRRLGYDQGEMCAHGFRAMASTLLNEQNWPRDVIERQLAHAERNKVRATYNRAQHLPERRKMMQAWADYLDALKSGGRVTPLRRASTSV